MKKYKVIKEFSNAHKGDLLVLNEAGDYEINEECTDDGMYSKRYMCIDSDSVDTLLSEGILQECEEMDEGEKLEKVKNFIDDKLEQYKCDHENLLKDYEDGDIQTCVKVEADTVYFNLIKLLHTIKDLLDE